MRVVTTGKESMGRRSSHLVFLLLLFTLLPFRSANAHELEQSYIFLTILEDSLSGRIELTISDLNRALSLQLDEKRELSLAEIEPYTGELKDYLSSKLAIAAPGAPPGLTLGEISLNFLPLAQYVVVEILFPEIATPPAYLDFHYGVLFDVRPQHRGFVVIEDDWKTGTFDNEANISLIFAPDSMQQRLDLSSSTFVNGLLAMTKQGVHHIWIGIDHVLFLLALLLPSVMRRTDGGWAPAESFGTALLYVVKIVTLFTVAHTITLSAATLGALSLSSRLVESIIAISIAIAALDILRPVFHDRIWWVVFAFGLFHGFGFASVLGEINIPASYMRWSLLSFNVGVEIGQLAIVCIAFPLFYLLRNTALYRRGGLQAGAVMLMLVSMYWFVERAFEIDLPAGEYLNLILATVGLRV